MNCHRTDCHRTARPNYSLCESHLRASMTAAFGPRPVEQPAVVRESSLDPMCIAIAEAKRGVRPR
jgi:hypothetical protein